MRLTQAKRTGVFQLGPPGTTFWDGESKEFGKIRPEKEKEWGKQYGPESLTFHDSSSEKEEGGPSREL